MSTWLKLLPLELDGINDSDIIEPAYETEKNDRIVGQMSETAKRLFTLGMLLEKDAQQYILDFKYCGDKVKKLELEAKAIELAAKSRAIKEIMWISIRDELGLWNDHIGVRKGFKVITSEDTGNDIPPFIRRLFGGQL